MKMLIANYDRKLYFTPVTIGPVGGGGLGVVPAGEGDDVSWARLLMALLAGELDPPLDTWAGDRIAVLKDGDKTTSLLTETDVALYVLAQTRPCNFQYVLDHFTDVTELLMKDGHLELASGYDWYVRTFQGCCLKSLTPQSVKDLFGAAARECGAHFGEFLEWLEVEDDLDPAVLALVHAELDAQQKPGRARGPRSGSRRC
jgi:hypothetical protein